ncbi:hypothetical protein B738_14432 [Photorhabdus temperata subsp. temperata M1021]|nr:hypothetical protein B738_14432 [Photorhabdus temperata subsp. temperata M1021]
MDDLLGLFSDVADALGIGSVSIVEKDYYVVELLRLLQPLVFDTHKSWCLLAGQPWQKPGLRSIGCLKMWISNWFHNLTS